MQPSIPTHLGLIAGNGAYPLLLAESARKQGVECITAVAFRKETDPAIEKLCDTVVWVTLGKLTEILDALSAANVTQAVMAGQLTPTALFRVRPDAAALALLAKLPERNAQTIFSAACDALHEIGVDLLPAHVFMESSMTPVGDLTSRRPSDREQLDIDLGTRVARTTSNLDIGQTVVIKEGSILAVEAFEGTDATIKRAADLGGSGIVVVKVSKRSHDMRFDIPVVGTRTIKLLKKVQAGALALESGRTILLERDVVLELADKANIAIVGVNIE